MSIFQWGMLPVLCIVAIADLARFMRDRRRMRLLRTAIWIIAALLIADPDSATSLARMVGIGRGTDLVFYLFMLVTPVVLFHLYSQQFRIRQDIVLLARREALRTAAAGAGLPRLGGEITGCGDSFDVTTPAGHPPVDTGARRD